jgi:transcriptional regulator with XRE-family HTH domain
MHAHTPDLSMQGETLALTGTPVNGGSGANADISPNAQARLKETSRDQIDELIWRHIRQRLMELAGRRGWSLTELSRNAGLADGAASDIVHARSVNPRMGTLLNLAHALRVPLASLLPSGGVPQAEIDGQPVYRVPLFQPRGSVTHVVVAVPPALAKVAAKDRLLAWAVTSAMQVDDLRVGDIVVVDTTRLDADGAAHLLTMKDQVMVARATLAPAHGMVRLDFDGMPPAMIDEKEVTIHGRVVSMIRPVF